VAEGSEQSTTREGEIIIRQSLIAVNTTLVLVYIKDRTQLSSTIRISERSAIKPSLVVHGHSAELEILKISHQANTNQAFSSLILSQVEDTTTKDNS
jgi:hypothetical protein